MTRCCSPSCGSCRSLKLFSRRFLRIFFCHLFHDSEKSKVRATLETIFLWGLILIIAPLASVAQAFVKFYISQWQGLLVKDFVGLGNSTNSLSHNGSMWWENVGVLSGLNVADNFLDLVLVDGGLIVSILTFFWRGILTRYLLERFLSGRNYYEVLRDESDDSVDNPDQRIASDVKDFTANLAMIFGTFPQSFAQLVINLVFLILQNGAWMILAIAFWPFCHLIVHLSCSSALDTAVFNKDKSEGDFRRSHTRIREHSESMAFFSAEMTESNTLRTVFRELYQNTKKLIIRYFGISFWIWITWNVPSAMYITVLAILFQLNSGPFKDDVLTSSDSSGKIMALFYLTLNITYSLASIFGLLESFGIVLGTTSRVGQLIERCDDVERERRSQRVRRSNEEDDESIVVENVSVRVKDKCIRNKEKEKEKERLLIENCSFEVKEGQSLMIQGESGSGKSSLLRVVAGLWPISSTEEEEESSRITVPSSSIFFLPQKSYIFKGSMRQNVTYPNHHSEISIEALRHLLDCVGLAHHLGDWNLNEIRDWDEELSIGEMQRVGFARLLFHNPKFVFLDEASSALDSENETKCYGEVLERGITCISIAHRDCLRRFHSNLLTLSPDDASWSLDPIDPDDIPQYEYDWEEIDSSLNYDDEGEGIRQRQSDDRTSIELKDLSEMELSSVDVGEQVTERHQIEKKSDTSRFFQRFLRLSLFGSCCCSKNHKPVFMKRKKSSWCALIWTTILAFIAPYPDLLIVALSSELLNAAVARNVGMVFGIAVAYFASFFLSSLLYSLAESSTSVYALQIRTSSVDYLHERYLRSRMYYEVNVLHEKIKNPDQRITQDLDYLTSDWAYVYSETLQGVVSIGIQVIYAFIMGYWSLPFICAGVFVGVVVVMVLLMWLVAHFQFLQQKREGYFRHSLGRLHEHAEQIAFLSGAAREDERVRSYFSSVMSNQLVLSLVSALNDTVIGLFYKVALILPYLIISASVAVGTHDLTLTSAAERITIVQTYSLLVQGVFETLVGLVSTANSIGQVVGNTGRVAGLVEHFDEIEEEIRTEKADQRGVRKEGEENPTVSASRLSVSPPNKPENVLFSNVTFAIEEGEDLLIRGVSGVGKSSIMRVMGGLWENYSGEISCPPLLKDGEMDESSDKAPPPRVLFLPQKAYMLMNGTLRAQVAYPRRELESNDVDDERMLSILEEVRLSTVLESLGEEGLDSVQDWGNTLSPGEQQRLSMARLLYNKPKFAFLDESTSSLDTVNEENLYSCCKKHGITVVSVGHGDTLYQYHSRVLELYGKEKGWSFRRKKVHDLIQEEITEIVIVEEDGETVEYAITTVIEYLEQEEEDDGEEHD